jgi:hypothetical protein
MNSLPDEVQWPVAIVLIPLSDMRSLGGPGEAKEADLGVAGGKGVGILIKKGEIVKKVPESELLSVLKDELDHWGK